MALFSKQKAFCNVCGKEFETDYQIYRGIVCGKDCYHELEWRKVLSIMGKEYKPQSESKEE